MPRPRVMYLRVPVGEGRDALPGIVRVGGWGWGLEVVSPSVRTGL